MAAIVRRLEDPKSNIKIGKDGLEISAFQAAEARQAGLQNDLELVKSAVFTPVAATSESLARGIDAIPQELRAMAAAYLKISDPDWSTRVRHKDEAAREMANYVIEHAVSRDALGGEHDEGLILALAAAVHAFPEAGDPGRILRVADEVDRLHVQYRIVLASGRLVERGLTTTQDTAAIRGVLRHYRRNADDGLRRRIDQTMALIDQVDALGASPA